MWLQNCRKWFFFKWKMMIYLLFFFSLRQSFKREDRIESCWQKDSGIDHSGPFTQNAWPCSSAQWQNKPRKRQLPGKREPPPDPGWPQAGTAVGSWRWNIAAAEKRVTEQRCGEDEGERTRFTQRHVPKVRRPVREPCGWDSRSENKVKGRQGSIYYEQSPGQMRNRGSAVPECAA